MAFLKGGKDHEWQGQTVKPVRSAMPVLCRSSEAAVVGALLLALILTPRPALSQPGATDAQVMAAFLYNFTNFVEWPGAQDTQKAAFELCVWGEPAVADLLEKTVNGRPAGSRPIVIRHLSTSDSLKTCQVVFFDQENSHVPKLLDTMRQLPILTVGAIPDFARQGGIVEFFMDGNRVKFRINTHAAGGANLKISSKLLALAQIVGKDQ